MILQERDKAILDFIERFKAATTSQIAREFFHSNSQAEALARRRLKKLCDEKLLKRERNNINAEYVYYTKKSAQMAHQLILVDFYLQIKRYGQLIEFTPEKVMGDIRSDAVCKIVRGNLLHLFCVEVELSNNNFNQQKYETFYSTREYKKWFEVFPKIIIICDKNIKVEPSRLRFVQVPTTLEGLEVIF